MEFIDLAVDDGIAYLRLNRGKSNAMHHEMIVECRQAIEMTQKDPTARALLIMGKDGFFSAGLDLVALYEYDENEMRLFWYEFIKLIETFLKFDKPAVAAINGHSPAGGCVLALCCDYRIMAEGDFVIGLNELPVGIIVPEGIFQLYSFWLGHATAYQYLLEGKLVQPAKALSVGLINAIEPHDKIITAAERKVRKFLEFEPQTWRKSKRNLRKNLIEHFAKDPSEEIESILEQWWSPSTRNMLKSIIDGLKMKKS